VDKFGEAVPSEFSPNEFGAQKVRHQPLAKPSGTIGLATYFETLGGGEAKDAGEASGVSEGE